MRRIAFFVEGLTERIFVEKLVEEIFGQKNIVIQTKKIQGGNKSKITIIETQAPIITTNTKYYVLIYDCGGDSKIRSYIDEQRQSLIKTGYEKIIGIRDVFPELRTDIHMLTRGLYFKTPQIPIPTVFILAVMEIEAWFLAEHSHFLNIDPKLTTSLIQNTLGFDPETDDMEIRNNPAADLNDCYRIVGKSYTKKEAKITRTINALSFSNLYFNTRTQLSSLNNLISEIDSIFV